MTASDYELLVSREDVVAYLDGRGMLPRLAESPDEVTVTEVTAGNMNRVFIARGPLGSIAVKQAPPWVQVVGPEWPIDPGRIASEARAYDMLARLVPETVPAVEALDPDRYILVMEDLSDLRVLRDVLVDQVADHLAGRPVATIDFVALGRAVGRFSAELSLATSTATLDAAAHAALIEQAANPELSALTDAVVLDEPYREHEHNHWLPELDTEVRAMYRDRRLLDAVARVRSTFENRAEALIHGDLHTGSLMIGARAGVQAAKVFDPEFSFVGPIGMDLGIFWANMVIASIAARTAGAVELAGERLSAVSESWAEFVDIVRRKAQAGSVDGLGIEAWLARIDADAWGFAGVESIRRVAGFSHSADLTTLPHELSVAAHAELLQRAIAWVIEQRDPITAAETRETA